MQYMLQSGVSELQKRIGIHQATLLHWGKSVPNLIRLGETHSSNGEAKKHVLDIENYGMIEVEALLFDSWF